MPHAKLDKLEQLISDPKWLQAIGSPNSYDNMADFIMSTFKSYDMRTVRFWIGYKKRTWVPDKRNEWFSDRRKQWIVPKKAVYEWQDGFLQRNGWIENCFFEDNPYFKILKGVKDGKVVTQPVIHQNGPHP